MRKKTILIVDDEPHVIRVLRLALEREGYDLHTASNGEEALRKLEAGLPDVLITDLQMPKAGGRVLCETARARYPDQLFPILVMTSMTALEEREWVAKMSNVEFFEKPMSPRKLVARLAAHFDNDKMREAQHA